MNPRSLLLVALIAAVLGGLVGYMVGSTGVERSASAQVPVGRSEVVEAVDAVPAPATRLIGDASAPDGARAPAVRRNGAAPIRVGEGEIERALDAVAAPLVVPVRGEGSIDGIVHDETGAPLAGVGVVAKRTSAIQTGDSGRAGRGVPEELDLESYLRAEARTWAEERAGRVSTISGADGRFELTGLAEAASYRVSAHHEGLEFESLFGDQVVGVGQHVIFRARRVVAIQVRLEHPDGSLAESGLVSVSRSGNERFYDWSVESSEVRLATGRVALRGYGGSIRQADSRGGVDATLASQPLDADVSELVGGPVVLVLEPRVGIRGRVHDEYGVSGDWNRVRLLALPPDGELDQEALATSLDRGYVRNGRYAFLDLQPGPYAVGLTSRSDALLAQGTVTVVSGIAELDLVVPEPDPDAFLVAHVRGPNGAPLDDLDFGWRYRRGSSSGSSGLSASRRPDGSYWLKPEDQFFEAWPDETSYTLTVEHESLGDKQVELEQGVHEIELRYAEPVTLVVQVNGYPGSGYESRLVIQIVEVAADMDEQAWWHWNGRNDDGSDSFSPDGEVRFEGLAPGSWEARLRFKGSGSGSRFGGMTRVLASGRATAEAGEARIELSLPALHDLVVRAPMMAGKGHLQLSKPDEEGSGGFQFGIGEHAAVDEDGLAVFEDLVAGDYVIGGYGLTESVSVTVPCGEVLIESRAHDCVRVAIGDTEGALYRAGLRAGDLIVAVDGTELEEVRNAWKVLMGEGEARLTVLRAGGRLDVSIERVAWGPGWQEQLGGMLTPAFRP